jgi:hypothetical protein
VEKQRVDYLGELRRKGRRREKSAQELLEQMERMKLGREERQERVRQFTERLEQQARRREQLGRVGDAAVDDELDALYLEAIEAKLSLLDDI